MKTVILTVHILLVSIVMHLAIGSEVCGMVNRIVLSIQRFYSYVGCCFHFAFVCNFSISVQFLQRDGARFNVRMSENGTSFNEKININEKQNTISFSLPAHNGVDRSDVLHDFNLVRKYTLASHKHLHVYNI